jgi:uncharacterized protein (DUF1810 family)
MLDDDDDDPFDLGRFVQAQAPVIGQVQAELAAGRKASHWMWFVFPQLKSLGRSSTARHYGLASREETLAYWRHPVLGPRLAHCTALVLAAAPGRSAIQIFGSPDDLKFRSCCTLFEQVAPEAAVFAQALQRFYGGERDPLTLQALGAAA